MRHWTIAFFDRYGATYWVPLNKFNENILEFSKSHPINDIGDDNFLWNAVWFGVLFILPSSLIFKHFRWCTHLAPTKFSSNFHSDSMHLLNWNIIIIQTIIQNWSIVFNSTKASFWGFDFGSISIAHKMNFNLIDVTN